MKYTKVIWLILTEKLFRNLLCDAVIYALISHDKVRGFYSPSVLQLNNTYISSIFDKQYQMHIEAYKEKFISYFKPN